uniref:Copper homeostasis protein cutC homolog n=1 Tax=Plectus sambesii TaxID=2011161 RepID=A0A914V6G1_9BILA
MQLEICVDTFASAHAAFQGGADRIEVCSALPLGGLTPTIGLLRQVKRAYPQGIAMCMLRPRGGDFVYDANEMATALDDLQALKEAGADGFVFGALDRDGNIDEEACGDVIRLAKPLPVTLHRAIDHSIDWQRALETAIGLGFSRVLSSGQATTAIEGIVTLTRMVAKAIGRIGIVVGSGVSPETLPQLLMKMNTHVDFHGSASASVAPSSVHRPAFAMGSVDTDVRRETSVDIVRRMKALLRDSAS